MFGLVGCSKSKRGEDEPEREFPARDLYDSWLFDGRVDAVETNCDDWAIFSAEHGYVEPDERLAYYDTRITKLESTERRDLAADVVDDLPETDELMILMGRDYADPLQAALPNDVEVWDPLEGVQLFDQRSALRELADRGEQQRLVTDGGSVHRWCDGCEDETPHRQVGDESAPGPTYECLACPERLEIEAALGIGNRKNSTGTEGGQP